MSVENIIGLVLGALFALVFSSAVVWVVSATSYICLLRVRHVNESRSIGWMIPPFVGRQQLRDVRESMRTYGRETDDQFLRRLAISALLTHRILRLTWLPLVLGVIAAWILLPR